MTIKIVTDSGSDITQEEAKKLGIIVVPLYLRFGDKVYRDGVDMDSDEFYRKLITSPVHPSTASPSPGDFTKAYQEVARETGEIVSIHATSKHSAVYQSALLGKESVEKTGCHIEVLDSKGVTMWQGIVAMAAAKAAEAGDSFMQVVNKVHETIGHMRLLAFLDTITYIVKGGRLGRAASVMSRIESLLHVKPLLTLHNGEIRPVGLIRSRSKGMERLREFMRSGSHIEDLAIVHSTTPEDARSLADYACSLFPNIVPRVARLGPVLGVHGGPGVLITILREAR